MHIAQHLTHDHFDVLVVDVNASGSVDALHFTQQVMRCRFAPLESQDLLGIARSGGERRSDLDALPVFDEERLTGGYHVLFGLIAERMRHDADRNFPRICISGDLDRSLDLSKQRCASGNACLEEFSHAWQALSDIALGVGNSAAMKGAHRELGARLANGLPGNDAYRDSWLDKLSRREILSVTAAADAVVGLAGEGRAHTQPSDPGGEQTPDLLFVEQRSCREIINWFGQDTPLHPARHIWQAERLALLVGDEPAFLGPAVFPGRPDLHARFHEFPGQVA